jgi:hypothetical protein
VQISEEIFQKQHCFIGQNSNL